ncbi:hypothetical protein [Thalassotalea euphylliae]|uniref:STAS domain-containing protein n=1 Tax=Thalassotalea euphylliae TaxID=1655234 RepID=A0A3E0UC79_9GAMM|nr:hypothetical protein [Thalassotalea euphylliae]REL34486.1 hypothetical protein DXX92_03470 [Thalassotalea euphylliae]
MSTSSAILNVAHGKFQLAIEDDILSIVLRGEANEQSAAKYIDCVATQVNKLSHKPFGILIDTSGFRGATPGAFEVSNRYNKQLLNMPSFAGKAVVCSPSTSAIYNISVAQQQHAQQQVEQGLQKQFNDTASASQWLRQQIIERY